MRSMLRSRRGSAAFATVIALIPLIGAVAFGAEAGSWYVTKQHAQNAADSAVMSGAMTLAIQNAGDSTISDSKAYDYRAKESAAQNAFCNAGDTSYPGSRCATSLPKGISHTVQINLLTSWNGNSGTFVRATVSQQQPAYLAGVLGLSTVTIGATAIAQVQNSKDLCSFGLGRWPSSSSALTLGGSVAFTGNGCGLMSNNTVKYASTPTFSGSGWAVDAVNGCVKSGTCDPGVPYNYNMLPATNPLQTLDTQSFNSRTGNSNPTTKITCPLSAPAGTKNCYSVVPNGTGAYGNLSVSNNDYVTFAAGTYFFYNATIKITGGVVAGTDVTLVLLGDSTISINGGTVRLSAPANNATYPALSGVLIDDQAPNKTKNAVTINGGGTVALGGAMYFPNVDVTFSGTTANTNTTCTEVIANTLTMSGSAYMSTQNCAPGTIAYTQVVSLVQ